MKVIVSDPISDDGLNIFYENNIEVIDATNSIISENYEHISTASGWLIRSGTKLDAGIINKADKLVVIGRAGVGIDNIDISAATRKGVVVMNTPETQTPLVPLNILSLCYYLYLEMLVMGTSRF